MNSRVRWISVVIFVVAVYCRLNARMVLPSSGFGWSGDFWASTYGVRLSGFADICNVVLLLSGLTFVSSFMRFVFQRGAADNAQ